MQGPAPWLRQTSPLARAIVDRRPRGSSAEHASETKDRLKRSRLQIVGSLLASYGRPTTRQANDWTARPSVDPSRCQIPPSLPRGVVALSVSLPGMPAFQQPAWVTICRIRSAEAGAQFIADHQVRRLPLLNRNQQLVGMIAIADIYPRWLQGGEGYGNRGRIAAIRRAASLRHRAIA